MEFDLLVKDILLFLDKYNKFMDKNIYITSDTCDKFINNYKYLYEEIEKNKYIYQNSINYKEMMSIINNKNKLIKLHNQKYLDSITNKSKDKYLEKILLCEEENILIIDKKRYIDIIEKIISKYNKSIIIVDNIDILIKIKERINKKDIYYINDLIINNLDNKYKLIDKYEKYNIISDYIKTILYNDKTNFNKFYNTFKNYLYFNKDITKYNNFKDYHKYIYNKMFKKSNLSIKDYNKKMIIERRNYLRNIDNFKFRCKEEVDIANFLYLNCINYSYDNIHNIFNISDGNNYSIIKYIDDIIEKKLSSENDICLYKNNNNKRNILNNLVSSLKEKNFTLKKREDIDIFNRIMETCENGYFTYLISEKIIPIINNYDSVEIKISKDEKNFLDNIYNYYKNYCKDYNLIDLNKGISLLKNKITLNYDKVILLEGENKQLSKNKLNNIFKKSTIINYNYQDNLFTSSIDNDKYKKYLNNKKTIPINNVYLSYKEIDTITSTYKKENKPNINKLDNNKLDKYYYSDNNRLKLINNKVLLLNNLLNSLNGNVLILIPNIKDSILLFNNKYFNILKPNLVESTANKDLKIEYNSINNKINKVYDYIIIIDLESNKYDNIKIKKYDIDIIVYYYLLKTKNKLMLITPDSKRAF